MELAALTAECAKNRAELKAIDAKILILDNAVSAYNKRIPRLELAAAHEEHRSLVERQTMLLERALALATARCGEPRILAPIPLTDAEATALGLPTWDHSAPQCSPCDVCSFGHKE